MSYYTLLTATGAAEFINAQAGGTTVPFTHLVLGDGNGAPITPLESMTALVHQVHRVPISSVTADVNNPNWLVVEAVVPTAVGGWTVREIGLVGGSGVGDKLLAAGNFPDTYKPLLAEGSGRDLVVRMIVQVGNASVVHLTVDPSVALATNQSIANAVATHEAKLDPHPQYMTQAEADGRYSVAATVSQAGIVELATTAEATAGTDTARAVTPTGVAAVMTAHTAAADPHAQYIKTSQKGAVNGIATLGGDGLVPPSQLPQHLTPAEGVAVAVAAVAAHEAASDPHQQYMTQPEVEAQMLAGRALRYFHAGF